MSFKQARERAGLKQKQAAEILGVTPGAVAQWESGIAKPAIDRLMTIAKTYGCTVEELLKEEGK